MACRSSMQTVEKALHSIDGLTSVQVRLNVTEVIIEKYDSVTLDQLITALYKVGSYSLWICESYNLLTK